MDFSILKQLGSALILAGLIGLEREQKSQRYSYDIFGGIRTLTLVGLIGALSFILSKYSIVFFAVLTSGFIGLIISSYVISNKKNEKVSATSEIASILVYIIGMFCAMEQFVLATTVALITLSVLHFKKPLHEWAKHLENKELVSTIEFIVIAFVILPLLPNKDFGPYGFFNPYVVWLMVVFISGISFASYLAIKLFGAKRGIGITGFLAGLISSTALVLSFSVQSQKNKRIVNSYVIAVIIASSAMFFRILFEVFVLNPELLRGIVVPMVAMGVTGLLAVLVLWLRREKGAKHVESDALKIKSPFSVIPALKFGFLFAAVLFLVRFTNDLMGDKGIYLTSVVSGIVDVDAITVSMANFAKDGISNKFAVNAITLAAMTNTLVKGIIFMIFGNRKVAVRIAFVFLLMLGVGGISLLFM